MFHLQDVVQIRAREAWRESRRRHDRFSVYQYLGAVFDLVMVWDAENRAVDRATRALRLKGWKGESQQVFPPIVAFFVLSYETAHLKTGNHRTLLVQSRFVCHFQMFFCRSIRAKNEVHKCRSLINVSRTEQNVLMAA